MPLHGSTSPIGRGKSGGDVIIAQALRIEPLFEARGPSRRENDGTKSLV